MIIFLSGYSGSGKTTFANSLKTAYPATYLHVDSIKPLRKMFYEVYGVYPESQRDKSKQAPNCQHTYQEMLESWYYFQRGLDPYFAARVCYNEGSKALKQGLTPIYSNIRQLEETQYVLNLGSPIVLVSLSRSEETPKHTDRYLEQIRDYLLSNALVIAHLSYHDLTRQTLQDAIVTVDRNVQNYGY